MSLLLIPRFRSMELQRLNALIVLLAQILAILVTANAKSTILQVLLLRVELVSLVLQAIPIKEQLYCQYFSPY